MTSPEFYRWILVSLRMEFMVNDSYFYPDSECEFDLDRSENRLSSGGKRGRGRPPKSASPAKTSTASSNAPKRGRGRPPKAAEATTVPKKAVVAPASEREASANGDASKKKRGRPSKSSTPHEQVNGISKPQVMCVMISVKIITLVFPGSTNSGANSSRTSR